MPDKKERQLLGYFYERFRANCFDEKDVYAFFILTRRFLDRNSLLLEFGDLIAHRERHKGRLFDSLVEIRKIGEYHRGKVPGCKGIYEDEFTQEFNTLLKGLGYDSLQDSTITDIMLCVCSIAQFSSYKRGENAVGRVFALITEEKIYLLSDGTGNDLHVVLLALDNRYMTTDAVVKKKAIFCSEPIVVFRQNNRLVVEYKNVVL
jgi:hypothetical protein